MDKKTIFNELATYYDLLYADKDYRGDAERLRKIIKKYKTSQSNTLLEAACGTGRYLYYLRKYFSCTGIDISAAMLAVARKKVTNVRFLAANMTTMSLDKKFDVIICMFGSISYVKTSAELVLTLRNFSNHLAKGGVLIFDSWFTPTTYKVGTPYLKTFDSPDLKIARAAIGRRRGNLSIIDIHGLIAERNKGVRYSREKQEMGLFTIQETLEYLREAGFKPYYFKRGFLPSRGLYVGVKL